MKLARLVHDIRCDAVNFTYCQFQSSMIVIGEMSVGIVVACVPTFGPVFFPKRIQKNTGYQPPSKERSRGFRSMRTPIGRSTTTASDEGTFHALEDDEIELNRVLRIENLAFASHGSENGCSDHDFEPNTIVVRKDLSIVGTSKIV